ncbi:hypothetical protein BD324DRAFT_639348 [Kockovaella imperatae]|uniref:Uncharacterized protein n=1 Tax=Kockovaella imperatae TaxID=4999 RepID=A0A1Y1U6A4_9TREE|nr:hypothetical protein BD324DRAFT_639348 [Kockovaella imperatae]ORX33570.1 hypothetical protein BD324DRAFT_639348 [Kockovaella imperatae]
MCFVHLCGIGWPVVVEADSRSQWVGTRGCSILKSPWSVPILSSDQCIAAEEKQLLTAWAWARGYILSGCRACASRPRYERI